MNTFFNPVRVVFGSGIRSTLPTLLRGRRSILITSAGTARRGDVATLERTIPGLLVATYADVQPNPTLENCAAAAAAVRSIETDVVIALGGGSVLDTSKVVASLLAPGVGADWLFAHLREGAPFPADFRPPPILAIPTTAGTGSEVTMWGTVWDRPSGRKCSISHPRLFPEAAIVDPELTLSMPTHVTVATALDAMSHSMEAIWNRFAHPISDALAREAIETIARWLPAVVRGAGLGARLELQRAALLAGIAMSTTRTAIAHSISYPLTSELGLPHGLACSFTLPEILRTVSSVAPDRAALIATALDAPVGDAAVEALYRLFREVGVAAEVTRFVRGADAISNLRGDLIAPGRADNSLFPVDQQVAMALLLRAYAEVTDVRQQVARGS